MHHMQLLMGAQGVGTLRFGLCSIHLTRRVLWLPKMDAHLGPKRLQPVGLTFDPTFQLGVTGIAV